MPSIFVIHGIIVRKLQLHFDKKERKIETDIAKIKQG